MLSIIKWEDKNERIQFWRLTTKINKKYALIIGQIKEKENVNDSDTTTASSADGSATAATRR